MLVIVVLELLHMVFGLYFCSLNLAFLDRCLLKIERLFSFLKGAFYLKVGKGNWSLGNEGLGSWLYWLFHPFCVVLGCVY